MQQMALQPASEGGKGGVMKYFVPGHLLGSSRPEMEKCSVMRPIGCSLLVNYPCIPSLHVPQSACLMSAPPYHTASTVSPSQRGPHAEIRPAPTICCPSRRNTFQKLMHLNGRRRYLHPNWQFCQWPLHLNLNTYWQPGRPKQPTTRHKGGS